MAVAEWETSNLQTLCRSCHSEKTARENTNTVPGSAEWRRAINGKSDLRHSANEFRFLGGTRYDEEEPIAY